MIIDHFSEKRIQTLHESTEGVRRPDVFLLPKILDAFYWPVEVIEYIMNLILGGLGEENSMATNPQDKPLNVR